MVNKTLRERFQYSNRSEWMNEQVAKKSVGKNMLCVHVTLKKCEKKYDHGCRKYVNSQQLCLLMFNRVSSSTEYINYECFAEMGISDGKSTR